MKLLAILLLLTLGAGASQQQPIKPRGFQAARQEGQRASRAQQPSAPTLPQQQPKQATEEGWMPFQQAGRQQGAGTVPIPLQPPPLVTSSKGCRLSSAGWVLVAAAAVGLFACGMVVGASLQRSAAFQRPHVLSTAVEPAGPETPKAAASEPRPVCSAKGEAEHGGGGAAKLDSTLERPITPAAGPSQKAVPPPLPAGKGSPQAQAQSSASGNGLTAQQGAAASAVEGQPAGAASAWTGGAVQVVEIEQVVLQRAEQQQQQQGQQVEQQVASSAGPVALGSTNSSTAMLAVGAGGSGGSSSLLAEEDRADIVAAGALVGELTRSLQIDLAVLSPGERLQLMHTVLQAWQTQQAKRHSQAMTRLGSEANVLRGHQRDIAAAHVSHKQAKDAHALARERVAQFQRACSDVLAFGLALMLAVAGYQAAQGGGVAGAAAALLAQCGRLGAPGSGSWGSWGLVWRSWGSLRVAGCYALTVGDALIGLAVLLAAPWVVYRSGMLSGVLSGQQQGVPFTRLLVGLGLSCGWAGYVAVGKLGGDRLLWLAVWEAWVALQVAFAAAAHRIFRVSSRARAAGGRAAMAEADDMYARSSGWLYAVMWALVGVALPVATGWLPFRA